MRPHTKLEAKRELRGVSKALCASLENMVVESKVLGTGNRLFYPGLPKPGSWEDILGALHIRATQALSRQRR